MLAGLVVIVTSFYLYSLISSMFYKVGYLLVGIFMTVVAIACHSIVGRSEKLKMNKTLRQHFCANTTVAILYAFLTVILLINRNKLVESTYPNESDRN